MKYNLICTNCKAHYDSSYPKQICDKCGDGILEVIYNKLDRPKKITKFWDMESILPDSNYKHYLLGQTPLIKSYESENLMLKLEFINPTHSFKDRGSIVEIAKAKEYKYKEVVCASTGNMAYSIAYYAKLGGIKSHIFISKEANREKIRNIKKTHDAKITEIDGDFTTAQKEALQYSKDNDVFLTGDYCYRKEGQKTVSYELFNQLKSLTHIIIPIGNATLFSGMAKGFIEMKRMSMIHTLPTFIGVEATGCSPIVKALNNRTQIKYMRPKTNADAIAVGMPTFGNQAISAINNTKGTAVSVTDGLLISEQKRFLSDYGLMIELGGIASLAAWRKLSFINTNKTIAVITGSNV